MEHRSLPDTGDADGGRCPVCDGASDSWLTVRSHSLLRCRRCRHGWLAGAADPEGLAAVYDADYFEGDQDGYPDYLGTEPVHRRRARVSLDALGALAVPPGRLLDVGCAAGFLLDEARKRGWQVAGAEPSRAMREHARRRLGEDAVVPHGCAHLTRPLRPFDAVTLIQVLEHAPGPPRESLSRIAGQLRPGGVLLLETWDADSWTARAAGRHWQQLSPPSVRHWYTRPSLERALSSVGLSIVEVTCPGKVVELDHVLWLAQSRYLGRIAAAARTLLGRLGGRHLALPYRLDDLIRVLAVKTH